MYLWNRGANGCCGPIEWARSSTVVLSCKKVERVSFQTFISLLCLRLATCPLHRHDLALLCLRLATCYLHRHDSSTGGVKVSLGTNPRKQRVLSEIAMSLEIAISNTDTNTKYRYCIAIPTSRQHRQISLRRISVNGL